MKNLLYTGDNLFILYGLNSNSVDLIYLDPPFNSKRIYSAPIGTKAAGASFKDMWTWGDVDNAYLDKLISAYPGIVKLIQATKVLHSKAMMSYLTYMAQRIIELRRILKDTGSLYLHCDSTASHYLKLVLDEIFGGSNFRNEIIWQRNNKRAKGNQHAGRKFGANTDTIFYYTKSNLYFLNPNIPTKNPLKKFNKIDQNGRYYHTRTPIFCAKSMTDAPTLCYTWRGFTNPHPSGWRLSKERLEEEYTRGNIIIKEDGKLERRKYLEEDRGECLDNNWTDISRVSGKEATGYPTQKPLALLRRIIEASTKKDDVALDPFCGCATTCVAAQQLDRKWIGIDIEEKAVDLVMERLRDDSGLFIDFIHVKKIPIRTDVQIIKPQEIEVKEKLFNAQNKQCNGCGTTFEKRNLEVDHIIPKAKGGQEYYENYQLLCAHCNRTKGDRPMEYLRTKIKARETLLKDKINFGE